jgi:uncharacterized HAD superfamily protein
MKTIAWDIDDVLNNLGYEWFNKEWLVSHPGCLLKYEDLNENPPHRLLNIPHETYLDSLDKFRKSEGAELKPDTEILNWFNEYGYKYRHIVLSSVPTKLAHISAAWTLEHFGKWIRSFNFVPSLRKEINPVVYDGNKTEFLKWFGLVDIFIEDNENNLAGIKDLDIKGLLIDRPWNSSSNSIGDILKVLNSLTENE